MDIHQLKQRIDASGKKLATLGDEYTKSKDEIVTVNKSKFLVKGCPLSISVQTYRSLFHDRTDGHSLFCLIFDDISWGQRTLGCSSKCFLSQSWYLVRWDNLQSSCIPYHHREVILWDRDCVVVLQCIVVLHRDHSIRLWHWNRDIERILCPKKHSSELLHGDRFC